jgi:hypothetical protein
MARKRDKSPLRCAHCGNTFPRVACAGLFCGDDCEVQHDAHLENARFDLLKAGFKIHSDVPNLMQKDGVSIGIEHVKNIGIQKAIRIHQSHHAGIQLAKAN